MSLSRSPRPQSKHIENKFFKKKENGTMKLNITKSYETVFLNPILLNKLNKYV